MSQSVTSAIQDGLWYLAKLDAESAAASVCLAYQVTGELDLDALRTAWHTVVDRHPALRTSFTTAAGRPSAIIAVDGDPMHFVDVTAEPESVAEWAREVAATPLRLDGRLARLAVARFGEWDHAVVLRLHRGVADDESVSIVLAELSDAYAATLRGESERPRPLPAYTAFARAQRDQVAEPDFAERLKWWTAALTPPPPAPTLPVDRPRPPHAAAAGEVLRFEWGPEVTRPLGEFTDGVFPVLLAAFAALLGRYGGDERIAVGCPVSVRPPDFTGVVGAFQNTLALPVDLSGRPSLRELASRVGALVAEAQARADVPFAELVAATRTERDADRFPLCDALFVCHDKPRAELVLSGAAVSPRMVENCSARADLVLTVRPGEAKIAGSLEFRSALFDEDGGERLLSQFHVFLVSALREPDRPLADVPLEGVDRLAEAVRAADQIPAAAPAARPANELFHTQALRRPDDIALSMGTEETTYRALEQQAAIITAALVTDEIVAGSPVVVRMASGPLQVAAVIGVLDAGAHLACLGQGDTGERGKAVLADLRPVCLVVDGDPEEDELVQWYLGEYGGWVLDASILEPDDEPRPSVPSLRGARAYVTYTSGSTGKPKGIPQSHTTLAQFVTWFSREFRIGPGTRMAQWAAPGYDAALVEIFAGLVAGATLCLVPDRIRANPEKIVDWLVEQRATVFQTVPSFARQVLVAMDSRGVVPDTLTHVLLAGEALPADVANGLRAALPGARLINLYGPTESILATWLEVTADLHGTAPIGRSIPGRHVLVLDDRGVPCAAGVTGNLVIRSPYLTDGYLGDAADEAPFAPLSTLDLDGTRCYRTGDLAARRRDGVLEFRGRKDFQIKFNGVRVELTDIEAALAAHETVAECAVVAVTTSDRLVSRLVGYVVPCRDEAGAAIGSAAAWRSALRARFGKAMPPVSFHTMIGLPRGIGGKVDRRRLPEPAAAPVGPARTPETPVRTAVAALWAGFPGVRAGSADESFFAAGGRSLQVPILLERVHERFGVEVPMREFLSTPTVAGLSTLVETHRVSLTAATLRGEDRDTA
ncbi:Probable non ribosomal peptide synthetase protein [Alloactinosynnema sp. L-07]|uniref:non-ribosomal peptide synthetase n=1 Tax=Alloactinosynnema sp. L-07 TaxID=1653480 RepID=UPI00065EF531|nr:AMP-binding protein [Alloactinosynnema sp. L-07]CRK59452.1 Probable non ribosomal peptide synthetase protein [Alloactinosynnema sp. L-07]